MATPVATTPMAAAAPPFEAAECTASGVTAKLKAVGETVLADGKEYTVAKAAGSAGAQKCPTDAECAQPAGTRLYTRAPTPVAEKDLTSKAKAARVAAQTKCVFAGRGYSWFAGQLACVHGDNNAAPTNAHKCQQPAFCSTFDPNSKVGASKWTLATAAHNPTIGGSQVWTDSGTAVSEENPVQVRPRPTKCRRGKRVQKGATCFFANATWECLSKTKCGSEQPTGVANAVWGTPKATATETAHVAAGNALPWDRALNFVDPEDKSYAEDWASGAATKSSAYDEGSEAIGDDGKLYKCAPQEISGSRTPASDKAESTVTHAYTPQTGKSTFGSATTKSMSFTYNVNCARYPPTSKTGKKYWKASTTTISAANQPVMDLQPYDKDAGYAAKDKAVSGGVVYNCVKADFCSGNAPTTDAGKLGWRKTPFTTAGVTTYKSDGKTKPKYRWTLHVPASKYAYTKGDRVKSKGASATEYYRCVATGSECRAPFKTDGSDNAKRYPQAESNIWVKDADTAKYAANYLAANEVKAAAWGALARRTRWGKAHDSTAAYKAGDTSCESGAKKAAWVCASSAGCAKAASATVAGGWVLTRSLCVIKTDAQMKAAKADAYAYVAGQPYKGGDKVVVGGAGVGKVGGVAYTCEKAMARSCGRIHPELGVDAKNGGATVWTQLNGQVTTIAAPVSKEVEAVPLETLLANPSIRLRYGQAFQYKGVVYKCTDKTGVLCAGGSSEKAGTNTLYKVKAVITADKAEVAKAPVVATYSGGSCAGKKGATAGDAKLCTDVKKATTAKTCLGTKKGGNFLGCQYTPISPLTYTPKTRKDVEKDIYTELLASGKGWEQTYDTPKKDEAAWGKVDTKDALAFAKSGLAIQCDKISTKADACKDGTCVNAAKVPRWWLKGQVYCDSKSETTFVCKDPLLCGTKDPSTTSEADRKLAAFTAVWTQGAKTATAGKLFVQKPDLQATQNKAKVKAFDWDLVTKSTYKGTYAFQTGDKAVNGSPARLWECVGKAADCKATAPKADTAGTKWKLLTLDALAYTEAEMTAKSPVTQSCFAWTAGYPFLPGDVVCDPAAPSSRSWTVRDATVAAANKPTLKDEARLRAAWGLTTDTQRFKPDGTATSGLVIKFAKITAPKEGAAVSACKGWDDRVGAALVDVGTELTWCKGGRVYKCTEKQVASKRPCCSKTSPETAGNRCWALQRARGTTVVVTAATLDADYKNTYQTVHARDSGLGCTTSDRFGTQGTNWKAKTTVVEGELKLVAGRVCVKDKSTAAGKLWLARLRGASVTPRGKISDAYKSADKATWAKAPFNVQVADGALDGAALEEVLAGISYRDAAQRRVLLNVIGWFPGLCGDRPTARAAEPWKAVCRGDIAAAVTFALMGEPDALAYAKEYKARKLMTGAAWWQTAFRSVADSDCYEAERRKNKVGGAGADVKTSTPSCRFTGQTRGTGTAVTEATHGAVYAAADASKKHYYARGAGPSPLIGPADYNAFSKAITGSEAQFASAPETVLTYGVRWGVWRGEAVGVMPMAVALWRYVTPQASFLPSVHEVATGGWTPTAKEKASGLGAFRADFCTIVTLVGAMRALQTGAGVRDGDRRYPVSTAAVAALDKGATVAKLLPWEQDGVWDGTLGTAWRAIHARLGAKLPAAPVVAGKTALPYDYTCRALSKNAVQAKAATRGWPYDATAQKTWLKPNTTAQKCGFDAVPGNARLSVWADGDVARCEMASIKADEAKTMVKRYEQAGNEPRRQECQLWEGLTNPYAWAACPLKTVDSRTLPTAAEAQATSNKLQPNVHCMACRPLATSGAGSCDAACVAEFTKTKHAMWSCVDARHCARLEPKAGAANAIAWKPWTVYVNAASGTASFNTAFGRYAVREQPLVGTISGKDTVKTVAAANGEDVPCIPYVRAYTNRAQLAMTTSMYPYDAAGGTTGILERADKLRRRLYVCEPTHTTSSVSVTGDLRAFAAAAANGEGALLAASGDKKGPMTEDVTKRKAWVAVSGAMGRIVPTFTERYPDCLPKATAIVAAATTFKELAGTLDAGFETLYLDKTKLTTADKKMWNEAYPAQKTGATGAYWTDNNATTGANLPYDKWEYLLAPPTGIAVDIDGNLCTNLRGSLKLVANSGTGTVAASTPKPTAAARAFIGSISDALMSKALGATVIAANTDGKKTALTATPGTNDGLANAKAVLTTAIFTKLTAGVTGSARAQLKYWDFMAALATAPALCNVAGSGKLTGVSKRAICARDLAGLWAAMIATTNSYDVTKATVAKGASAAAKPYHLQGFEATGTTVCKRPNKSGVMTTATNSFFPTLHLQCTAAKISAATPAWGHYTAATGMWCKDAAHCAATSVVYSPRGPLALSGVLDTYWFAAHAQELATNSASSAMRDPTQLGTANAGSYQYWLAGIYQWMVPMGGRPAPHNVMTGLWEPTALDAAAGVPTGFGAVTKLLSPENCGVASKGVRAQVWRDSWTAMVTEFKLAAVVISGSTTEAATLAGEKADCAGADTKPFPASAWAQVPVYLTASYKRGSVVRGKHSNRCWGTHTQTKALMYKKGAYALCAWANKTGANAGAIVTARKAAVKIDIDHLKAATATAWGAAGDLVQTDLACRAKALKTAPTGGKKDRTGKVRAALRACKTNKDCELAANYCLAAPTVPKKKGDVCAGNLADGKTKNALYLDVRALALCPVNAACLARAGGEPAKRKACYLLPYAAADAKDKLIVDAADWTP